MPGSATPRLTLGAQRLLLCFPFRSSHCKFPKHSKALQLLCTAVFQAMDFKLSMCVKDTSPQGFNTVVASQQCSASNMPCTGQVNMPVLASSVCLLLVTVCFRKGGRGATRLAEGTLPCPACHYYHHVSNLLRLTPSLVHQPHSPVPRPVCSGHIYKTSICFIPVRSLHAAVCHALVGICDIPRVLHLKHQV